MIEARRWGQEHKDSIERVKKVGGMNGTVLQALSKEELLERWKVWEERLPIKTKLVRQ